MNSAILMGMSSSNAFFYRRLTNFAFRNDDIFFADRPRILELEDTSRKARTARDQLHRQSRSKATLALDHPGIVCHNLANLLASFILIVFNRSLRSNPHPPSSVGGCTLP